MWRHREGDTMSITVENLSKISKLPKREKGLKGAFRHVIKPEYTYKTAVDQINFTIKHGESVGYIGPNGAGKSTTIKMFTGILYPSSGTVQVEGYDPH